MTGCQQNHRLRLAGTVTRMVLICSAAASAEPNIVLWLVDDAGFSDYGGYGGEANTPNINRLADRGIRFTT